MEGLGASIRASKSFEALLFVDHPEPKRVADSFCLFHSAIKVIANQVGTAKIPRIDTRPHRLLLRESFS